MSFENFRIRILKNALIFGTNYRRVIGFRYMSEESDFRKELFIVPRLANDEDSVILFIAGNGHKRTTVRDLMIKHLGAAKLWDPNNDPSFNQFAEFFDKYADETVAGFKYRPCCGY